MNTERGFPEEITLRQALMQQLMHHAIAQGQTGIISQLLELNEVCITIDFLVIDYCDRLLHLEETLDLLLTSLENAPHHRLSSQAIERLVEVARSRLDLANGGLETLN